MTPGLPFMKNVLMSLAKNVLVPLRLTAVSATYVAIQKNVFGSGTIALIISIEEMEVIVQSLEGFVLF